MGCRGLQLPGVELKSAPCSFPIWTAALMTCAFQQNRKSLFRPLQILDLDRDFDDVGFASFMVKHLTIRNCMPHAKCKEILGAWNPPSEWGKACILKVEAKQGAPEPNGVVPILHFQVDSETSNCKT